ncbi:kelch-like protein 10 [Synchiropus picturatus]
MAESNVHKPTSVLNELRLAGQYCDAVIRVENVEFPVHKIVLSNCSLYFRSLFERWSLPGQKDFVIPNLSPSTMLLLIEFAYTSSVSVTENNVHDLLQVADYFNAQSVLETCWKFLERQLCPQNCVSIWRSINTMDSLKLQNKAAHTYVANHFEKVITFSEFTQLSVQQLADILERDDLDVRDESSVFEAVVSWIAHKPEHRRRHMALLLSKVRLALLNPDYIRIKVITNKWVKSDTDSLNIVDKATRIIHQLRTKGWNVKAQRHLVARPRLPRSVLLALGGYNNTDRLHSIEAYDLRSDRWVTLTSTLEHPSVHHGVVFLNGFIYCIGGCNQGEYFNCVYRFDLKTSTWHEVACMHCSRYDTSVTTLSGYIYALGGSNERIQLRSAERYKPDTNQWSYIAPMYECRSKASCATLHGKIYICGGFNGENSLRTAECYNPECDQWTRISSMISRRCGVGMMVYANQVYAVGGTNGFRCLRSAEVYNPETNSWKAVPSMLMPRSHFAIEMVEERLFSVGGMNNSKAVSQVEYYDVKANKWTMACSMENERMYLRSCVVAGWENMAEFLSLRDTLPPLYISSQKE